MYCENAFYFLAREDVRKRLDLEEERHVKGLCADYYWGRWRLVSVELHHYPIADDRAWLPHQHEYAGKMGTRVQAQAERYLDLLGFKLHLRSRIENRYRVPG